MDRLDSVEDLNNDNNGVNNSKSVKNNINNVEIDGSEINGYILDIIDKGDVASIIKLKTSYLAKPLINGNSLFSLLVSRGQQDLIYKIIKTNNSLAKVADINGDTILHHLGYYSDLKNFLKIAILDPTTLNTQNNNGETPLFYVLHSPDTLEVVIKNSKNNKKIDFNLVDINGYNVLTKSLTLSKKEEDKYYLSAKLLIESKKVDLNSPKDGTPVMIATAKGYLDILLLLNKHKADFNILNSNYISSLNIAVAINKRKVVDFVLKKTKKVDSNGPEGDDNLIVSAINKNDFITVDKLIDKGYDLNKTNRFLESGSHIVLDSNAPKSIVKKTLKKSDLNVQNLDGVTPLHLLVAKHDWKQYKGVLKNKRLDIFTKDSNNNTPLTYIKDNDLTEFTKLVVDSYINQSPSKKFKKRCMIEKNCFYEIFNKIVQTRRSYPENEDRFKIREINLIEKERVDFTVFNSDSFHNLLYTISFLNQNSNVFPIFKHKIDSDIKTERLKSVNMFRGENKLINYLVNNYRNFLYKLSPYLMVWKDPDNYFIDDRLEIYVKKLMLAKDIRFIFLKLTLVVGKRNTHANIVIYDKKTNCCERFDPYGDIPYLDIEQLDSLLKIRMEQVFSPDRSDFRYLEPKQYVGLTFQTLSNDSNIEVKKMGDPAGFCLAWTFWYLELRINNPDMHPKPLIEISVDDINKNSNSEGHYKFIDFIRNYADKLYKDKNSLLSSLGINKEKHYRKVYTEADEATIIKKIEMIFDKLCSKIEN